MQNMSADYFSKLPVLFPWSVQWRKVEGKLIDFNISISVKMSGIVKLPLGHSFESRCHLIFTYSDGVYRCPLPPYFLEDNLANLARDKLAEMHEENSNYGNNDRLQEIKRLEALDSSFNRSIQGIVKRVLALDTILLN